MDMLPRIFSQHTALVSSKISEFYGNLKGCDPKKTYPYALSLCGISFNTVMMFKQCPLTVETLMNLYKMNHFIGDEVVNCYTDILRVYWHTRNVLLSDPLFMWSTTAKKEAPKELRQNPSIRRWIMCVCVENHWICLAADMESLTVVCVDSLLIPGKNYIDHPSDTIASFVEQFKCLAASARDYSANAWNIMYKSHAAQQPPNECGIWAMIAMECMCAHTPSTYVMQTMETRNGDAWFMRHLIMARIVGLFQYDLYRFQCGCMNCDNAHW
jgi:hypothetical protein